MRQSAYSFPRFPESCAACGRKLEVGETVLSTIHEEGPEDAFVRRDWCRACEEGRPAGEFSFWRTQVPDTAAPARPKVDTALVFDFFQRLAESGGEERSGMVFFLALFLMRKRVLKFIDAENQGGEQEVWVLESRPEGRRFRVVDPRLSAEELSGLGAQIQDVLATGDLDLQ